jgi:hypothetical protein
MSITKEKRTISFFRIVFLSVHDLEALPSHSISFYKGALSLPSVVNIAGRAQGELPGARGLPLLGLRTSAAPAEVLIVRAGLPPVDATAPAPALVEPGSGTTAAKAIMATAARQPITIPATAPPLRPDDAADGALFPTPAPLFAPATGSMVTRTVGAALDLANGDGTPG